MGEKTDLEKFLRILERKITVGDEREALEIVKYVIANLNSLSEDHVEDKKRE